MTINEQIEAIKKADIETDLKKEVLRTLRIVRSSYSAKNGYSVIVEMSEARWREYLNENYDNTGNLK